ncbi:hypothetical protein Egran_01506 [Elaphomyces granulatus]|uniref:Uncharacterized protein n=1 Tax=Elaphomyces granulatus TaxID=519963 RepID=A0A232M2W2_9EURO|nr:hypothetical protein Egran_01506 [Elaphomyces granulatus]
MTNQSQKTRRGRRRTAVGVAVAVEGAEVGVEAVVVAVGGDEDFDQRENCFLSFCFYFIIFFTCMIPGVWGTHKDLCSFHHLLQLVTTSHLVLKYSADLQYIANNQQVVIVPTFPISIECWISDLHCGIVIGARSHRQDNAPKLVKLITYSPFFHYFEFLFITCPNSILQRSNCYIKQIFRPQSCLRE